MKHRKLNLKTITSKIMLRLLRPIFNKLEVLRSLRYEKEKKRLSTTGWSVVVITSGSTNTQLLKTIESASIELGPVDSEIIIVGPPDLKVENIYNIKIRHIKYTESQFLPGLITRKKNIGVYCSSYDKVVVCHDYIAFEAGWKKGFDQFGDDFDVCMTKVLFHDGRRARDWVIWDYPGLGPALLPYDKELTRYQYISGAYFIVKRDFYLENALDENLRWGEGEDVEWSLRIREKTKFVMNQYSCVRFTRIKAKDEPPYAQNWINNKNKLHLILKNDQNKINY